MRALLFLYCLGSLSAERLAAQNPVREPIVPVPVDSALLNPWPEVWEKEFRLRGDRALDAQCQQQKVAGLGGRTYFENEKRAYGILMAHLVKGDRANAIKELQRGDAQADSWHQNTLGIDYFACFTLKHQMRKYFLFGGLLTPEYRQRMFDGATRWTSEDPIHRSHPAFKKGAQGWGPDARNSWVDVRNTENLFLMRVTSVYLMAEETGNDAVRQKYKRTLLDYAASLYRVGMGEWDSENYHGHSLSPLLNLHDFAKDAQVKAAAKACLDYVCAVGAVKYFRGAFNGPTNRDYNHAQPFGGSAACMLWLYFGDTPMDNRQFESDEVHVLTSSYRPPAAVMHLARKNFDRPMEIMSSKPTYSASTTRDWESPPAYFETQYFGRTFQMGSLVSGTTAGKTAINGFKIAVWDEDKGGLAVQGIPGPDAAFVGSAKYEDGKVAGENRVAQNGNVAVWLVDRADAHWTWTLPEDIVIERQDRVTFLRGDRTWIALHPISLTMPTIDEQAARKIALEERGESQWRGHRVLSARGRAGRYCGVAIEVGEAPKFEDYAQFKQSVLSDAKVDASGIAGGIAEYQAASGRRVKLQFASEVAQIGIWRDGKRHDIREHATFAFATVSSKAPLIQQKWLDGALTVQAGSAKFVGRVDEKGIASFVNEATSP